MMNRRSSLVRAAAESIRKANKILLACHVRPDADALGSLLGLAAGLESLGKSVTAVSADGVPELYRFLPGWEGVRTHAAGNWDLAIGLDADGSDRLGPAEPTVLSAPEVIDIDHHTGPDPFGHVQLVDRTAAATGELVFELLEELGVDWTAGMAQCLMAAIVTDTGSFRYSNVTPRSFEIAAALVRLGAHPTPIYEAVYGSRPYEASVLLGRLLGNLRRTEDGRVVWAALSRQDFADLGLNSDATEGFVDQIRMVAGSEVAVFLREETNGDIRVSLRSRGRANVAQVADEFGGGGHVPAAGCTLPGPLPAAVDRVIGSVVNHLSSLG